MADADKEAAGRPPEEAALVDSGSYEVIRARLLEQGKRLGAQADALNERRVDTFGGTELTVVGNTRVRTQNNCVPRDIVQVGGKLLFGYNVFIGLKRKTQVEDVFSLHELSEYEDGSVELDALPAEPFLTDPDFCKQFAELYEYFKEAHLAQLRVDETKLLAIFRVGANVDDVKVFRWGLDSDGTPKYLDNRGERDHVFPDSHDFEWTPATRDDHVGGEHAHINILDECFVDTTGGDLTIKVEDNTASGEGVYAEPVEDINQALGDADVQYARVGTLVLLRIKPYRELAYRHLVFNTRTHAVTRIDSIGLACVSLPEGHGIIFPDGYYLQDGTTKVFEGDTSGLLFKRRIRSPNGEDVLYIFHRRSDGHYVLFPYNLIRKEVQNPIHCHGYSLFEDGTMVIFRSVSEEPTRVHPMQVWQTPFHSAEHAQQAPTDGGYLSKVGNAELVRGISDAYSVRRLAQAAQPTRQTYEDLIASVTRMLDAYYWLGHDEIGDLASTLLEMRQTAEQVVDEFEKVQIIRRRAEDALTESREAQAELVRSLRPDDWRTVDEYMGALTALRKQRGHLITLRDMRYMDTEALEALEAEAAGAYDTMSRAAVQFLLNADALAPLTGQLESLLAKIEDVRKGTDLPPIAESIDTTNEGLDVLSEVIANLEIDDADARTRILEGISEVYSHVNRVRATYLNKRKDVLTREGRAEFGVQFKLFAQSVTSAISVADTPDKCDESLSRLLVQLEELEGRFGEFDEFLGDLADKREEVYEAFGAKKQQLMDERQRRAQSLAGAAKRILEGAARRGRSFTDLDELNAYFASDAMILKLRDIVERLRELGDSVKADEIESRLKTARQDAMRSQRDRRDLFVDGDNLIRFGRHRFSVNTQSLELTVVPREGGMAFHLTGTDFYAPVADPEFVATQDLWVQPLVSESRDVYRGEYLAATILFAAEAGRDGLGLEGLGKAAVAGELLELVRARAADRYDEGYERGVHDADAARILDKLLALRSTAGLLRFAPTPRALACLFWASLDDEGLRERLSRRGASLGRMRRAFAHTAAVAELEAELGALVAGHEVAASFGSPTVAAQAGVYLAAELMQADRSFATSAEAVQLRDRMLQHLDRHGGRSELDEDLRALRDRPLDRFSIARAWVDGYVGRHEPDARLFALEAAVMLLTADTLTRDPSAALGAIEVTGLLGQHPRIEQGAMTLRLDEYLERLGAFVVERVPRYRAYRALRHSLIEREREQLRLEEFKPRVLSSFVRNKLIDEAYLPIIGDNLAKQLGGSGEGKRTDQMGLLLLISPPGYGKTTLMEYIASQLGLVFMKVNGPALGHGVHSLDPSEAPNATARQEVDKINLALEMGNNVMLYLDDIQHTHSELLQKFISLCDAQRRIEGVWRGKTRTYDMRGKKFCVVMAGNPYTESGEKFQIPDMLANRADTYNLGDILEGKGDQFALSYIENSLTSNSALAPIAARGLDDVYTFVRMARGEDVPASELEHAYSSVEVDEAVGVLKKLFVCQRVLLSVNQQYIASAAQEDAFRTEPRFQLQGSYRNMNKLAEKVVAAMNDAELSALIDDHYAGEAQTLTTGAESNLLKLAEMRGTLTDAQRQRWDEIKREFVRLRSMGGGDDDPVVRVTGSLGHLGRELESIRAAVSGAVEAVRQGGDAAAAREAARAAQEAARRAAEDERRDEQWRQEQELAAAQLLALRSQGAGAQSAAAIAEALAPRLDQLGQALAAVARPQLDVTVKAEAPPGITELLAQQVAIVERTLVPMVRVSTKNFEDAQALHEHVIQLLELMKRMDEQLKARFGG